MSLEWMPGQPIGVRRGHLDGRPRRSYPRAPPSDVFHSRKDARCHAM